MDRQSREEQALICVDLRVHGGAVAGRSGHEGHNRSIEAESLAQDKLSDAKPLRWQYRPIAPSLQQHDHLRVADAPAKFPREWEQSTDRWREPIRNRMFAQHIEKRSARSVIARRCMEQNGNGRVYLLRVYCCAACV